MYITGGIISGIVSAGLAVVLTVGLLSVCMGMKCNQKLKRYECICLIHFSWIYSSATLRIAEHEKEMYETESFTVYSMRKETPIDCISDSSFGMFDHANDDCINVRWETPIDMLETETAENDREEL